MYDKMYRVGEVHYSWGIGLDQRQLHFLFVLNVSSRFCLLAFPVSSLLKVKTPIAKTCMQCWLLLAVLGCFGQPGHLNNLLSYFASGFKLVRIVRAHMRPSVIFI